MNQSLLLKFEIRNTTNRPFTIVAVQKSCGCEAVGVKEGMVVPPDETLTVPYELSKYSSGPQYGRLVIQTNAVDQDFKEIVLTLRAERPKRLWATPSEVSLGQTQEGIVLECELRVESPVPGLLGRFLEVSTSRELVSVKLKEKTPEFLLFQVAITSEAPVGLGNDFISLLFVDANNPRLDVRVRTKLEAKTSVSVPPP